MATRSDTTEVHGGDDRDHGRALSEPSAGTGAGGEPVRPVRGAETVHEPSRPYCLPTRGGPLSRRRQEHGMCHDRVDIGRAAPI